MEDRRPAANMDPYVVTSMLAKTTLAAGGDDTAHNGRITNGNGGLVKPAPLDIKSGRACHSASSYLVKFISLKSRVYLLRNLNTVGLLGESVGRTFKMDGSDWSNGTFTGAL